MSDLFDLPESPLPPLEAARRKMETAWNDYMNIDSLTDEEIETLRWKYQMAASEVRKLEAEALRK